MRFIAPRALPLAVALAVATLAGSTAQASIKKYQVRNVTIIQSEQVSPEVDFTGDGVTGEGPPFPAAFVDDSTAGSPVLRKFVLKGPPATITVELATGAFIFVRSKHTEGPEPLGDKSSSFTGTGSTAAGSTIRWGSVTGWTISGELYCHSEPPVICSIGGFGNETTNEPFFDSDFFDLGTWTFHGTGFTATPYINAYLSTQTGNRMRWYRGFAILDATVPALPLLGVALLGGSLAVGAATALRRRRD